MELIEEYEEAGLRGVAHARAGGDAALAALAYLGASRRHGGVRGVRVRYERPRGLGRFVATVPDAPGSPSLATMKRGVRSAAARGLYHDVDMVNAQPALPLHRQGAPAL